MTALETQARALYCAWAVGAKALPWETLAPHTRSFWLDDIRDGRGLRLFSLRESERFAAEGGSMAEMERLHLEHLYGDIA